MKPTLSTTIVLAALVAFGGQAHAAKDAHEGYQRGFYGKIAQDEAVVGKTAAAPVAAKVPFAGPQGGTRVLTTTGVQAWNDVHSCVDTVIASQGASSADGHQGYRILAGKAL